MQAQLSRLSPLTHRPWFPLPSQSALETQLLASCTFSDLMSVLRKLILDLTT